MNKALALMLTLLLSVFAHADYHYASHSGSNIYPYASWETATDSVNAAVDAADPGDTIYIAAGDYEGLVVMYPADSLISIIGAGADSTHLFTNDAHRLIYAGPKTYFKGLKMSPLPRSPWECIWAAAAGRDVVAEDCIFDGGQGIITAASNLSVHNCIFENMGMGIFDNYTLNLSLEVTNCLFRNNEGNCIDVQSQHAIVNRNIAVNLISANNAFALYYIERGYQEVTNNITHDICADGIAVSVADTNSIICNNTLDHSVYPYIGYTYAMFIGSPFRTKATNNSITNSQRGILLMSDSVCSINYSDLFRNEVNFGLDIHYHGSFDTTYGLLHVNPMYNDPDSGDFRLQMYSPLIDAGDPNILDYDGSRSDIGAFGGPDGYFYQYQDLPPHTPDSLSAGVSGDSINLIWRMNTEADFTRYIINRDTISGFIPSLFNIISEPETSYFVDTNWDNSHNYYYRIAAIDNQGNQSTYSHELAVNIVGIWGEPVNIPYTTYIESNYPNPFNSSTTISFYVADVGPIPAQIEITIYDVMGRIVRKLLNEREGVGNHKIIFDGKDDRYHDLPSGVYFARISQWGIDLINKPRKLVIIK